MPSKADVKAWKAQLVAQAEQQILKLTAPLIRVLRPFELLPRLLRH